MRFKRLIPVAFFAITQICLPASAGVGAMGLAYTQFSKAPTATYLGTDTTTTYNWVGTYGSAGYNIIQDSNSYRGWLTVTLAGNLLYTWGATVSDSKSLIKGSNHAQQIAGCAYNSSPFTITVAMTDGQKHKLSLYFLDYDNLARNETITIKDGSGNVLDAARTMSSFAAGKYMSWTVGGTVVITITFVSGTNAVVSGIFLD